VRSAAGAVLSGVFVLVLFSVWLRYPIQLSLAIGAVFVVLFMLVAASIGANPDEADAAWRSAAPDLLGRPPADAAEGPHDGKETDRA
jgi:hypothetical protein